MGDRKLKFLTLNHHFYINVIKLQRCTFAPRFRFLKARRRSDCYTQNLEAPKRQTVNKVPEGANQSEDLCKLVQNLRSGRLSSEAFADVPELAGSRYFRTWWTWGPDWRRFRSSGLWTSAPPPRSPRPTCVPRSPAPPTRSDTHKHTEEVSPTSQHVGPVQQHEWRSFFTRVNKGFKSSLQSVEETSI